jgi:hypothetical protein
MLAVLMAQFEYVHEQSGTANDNKAQAKKRVQSANIEYGKSD